MLVNGYNNRLVGNFIEKMLISNLKKGANLIRKNYQESPKDIALVPNQS